MDDLNQLDNLNNDWINNFEEIDKNYSDFYLEDVYSLKIHFIYIDKEHNIEKIKQEKIIIRIPNYISREEIILLLKKNCHSKYTLLSILKYNIDMDSTDVKDYCKNKNNNNSYLTPIKNVDAIPFNRTISMFQDLNELIFIFCEKTRNLNNVNNNTKKHIIIKPNTTNKKKTIR